MPFFSTTSGLTQTQKRRLDIQANWACQQKGPRTNATATSSLTDPQSMPWAPRKIAATSFVRAAQGKLLIWSQMCANQHALFANMKTLNCQPMWGLSGLLGQVATAQNNRAASGVVQNIARFQRSLRARDCVRPLGFLRHNLMKTVQVHLTFKL